MARPEAPPAFTATVKGVPVVELCLQPDTKHAPHLVTASQGSHQLETTLRYAVELDGKPPHNSPFRPSKLGPFKILSVEITDQDILISTAGGVIRLPPGICPYSYRMD